MKPEVVRLAAAVAAACALLAACGGSSDKEMVVEAQKLMDKRDNRAAVIQLKNALQKNPQSADARYLLGKVLLDMGDPPAAVLELGKAVDGGADKNLVLPDLARAMLLAGEVKKLVDLYGTTKLTDKKAQAALQVSLAAAYASKGDVELGRKELELALAAAPDMTSAQLLKGRFQTHAGDLAAARKTIEAALKANPNSDEGFQLLGDLLLVSNEPPKVALEQYQRALALRPDRMPSHLGAVSAAMRTNDNAIIKEQFAKMVAAFPNHPETRFFEAQFALLDRDYKKANDLVQQLLRFAPENVKLLTLAGAIQYQMAALLPAENTLSKVLKLAPEALLARRMLGMTYVRLGKTEKALSTLVPAIEDKSADAELLSVAAEAYLQAGDFPTADALLQRAGKLSPDNPTIRTSIAISQLAKGNAAAAFNDLQAISKSDTGTTADLALITAHLQRAEYPQALEAIGALEKKQPDRPFAAFMRGRVQHLNKQVGPARESFQRALTIDPGFFPAVAALSALDMAEGKIDEAAKRFEERAKAEPKNYLPRLALVEVRRKAGAKPAEITALLQDAVNASPGDALPRSVLVGHYITLGDKKLALETAQQALAALPDNLDAMDALGRAQLAAGEYNQAATTFRRMANISPLLLQAHLRLADVYVAMKDEKSAIESLRRALEISPNLLTAQKGIMSLSMSARQPQDAIAIARAVQKQRPAEPLGYLFEGEVEVLRKNYPAAAAIYRTGLQRAPSTELAIRLHQTLAAMNQPAEAEKVAVAWETQYPKDLAFLFLRADQAMARGNWAQAESRFATIVAAKPKDGAALNNLAWLLLKQKKPGALPLAQRAAEVMPDKPAVLDTLAMALAEDKQTEQALATIRKAVNLVPDDYHLRVNLARIQIASGDKAGARAELERLSKLGTKLKEHAEVAEMLKTIS